MSDSPSMDRLPASNAGSTPNLLPQLVKVEQVLEQAPDAILVSDGAGNLLYANRHVESLFGYTAQELIGQKVETLIPPALKAAHEAHLKHLRFNPEASIFGLRREVTGIHRDGSEVPLELHVSALQTEAEPKFIATLRDIRERKEMEFHRKILAEQLASQMLELEKLHKAAQASSTSKSEFLANMSHEIRTPLTAILGYVDMLQTEPGLAGDPARRSQILETIKGAGCHLLTVINDILDLCRIEADKVTIERIEASLVAILGEVESLLRPRLAGKDVALQTILATPIPDRIICDPTRLRQILLNIVGNAVKFTLIGRVTVQLRVDGNAHQKRLVILVEDTGPGMTLEQTQQLFHAFSQGDSTVTRRYGGTGLGLVISARLAKLMEGELKLVWTEVGLGTCFCFDIPLVRAVGACDVSSIIDSRRTPPEPAQPVDGELSGRVLLAEDGLDNQRLISFILRKAGAVVEVADNGRIALEKLHSARDEGHPFNLLLTDMQMPEVDGYTLTRTLRAEGLSIPVIALTAHAMSGDREKCISAGCNDYMTKPIDRDLLIAICRKHIER